MSETNRQDTAPAPPDVRTASAQRQPSRPSKRRRRDHDRNAWRRRGRILAMQALYESELTDHDLDDILQHLGELERREHGEYFARIRGDTRKAVEEFGFLARNAGNDLLDQSLADYDRAAKTVLEGLFALPESGDGETAGDTLPRERLALEKRLRTDLASLRDGARSILAEPGDGHPIEADESRDAALAALGSGTGKRLETLLGTEERTAREAVMERLARTVLLARGVEGHLTEIDPHIERAAPAFPMPQLASIDRVVLRIAVYELLFEPEVPFRAAINEAVDIAKTYGGPNSGRFVNGVLRTISEGLPESRKSPPSSG